MNEGIRTLKNGRYTGTSLVSTINTPSQSIQLKLHAHTQHPHLIPTTTPNLYTYLYLYL